MLAGTRSGGSCFLTVAALDGIERVEVRLRCTDGSAFDLPVQRWMGDPRPEELSAIRNAPSPVLDVGCGTGRLVLALARRGVPALGLDTAPFAIHVGRARGASILQRSIFDAVPGSGRWGSALLFDGSIGIGGDPARLLRRLGGLVRAWGVILVELDPDVSGLWRGRARIERATACGPWFPWARVGPDAIDAVAAQSGLGLVGRWEEGGRWFASLTRA